MQFYLYFMKHQFITSRSLQKQPARYARAGTGNRMIQKVRSACNAPFIRGGMTPIWNRENNKNINGASFFQNRSCGNTRNVL